MLMLRTRRGTTMLTLLAALLAPAALEGQPIAPGPSRLIDEPPPAWQRIDIADAESLQRLFAEPLNDVHIRLAPGEYRLSPRPYTDPTCGNCPDPARTADTTVGLHIRGRNITFSGPRADAAVIHTGSGYGLLIDSAEGVTIENLTLTGGERSTDGHATDSAIVVRHSRVLIRNNRIIENIGDPAIVRRTVSGVMGIVGREGSDMRITGNQIIGNSWDGIALYREARALIEDNLIDGVDKATGPTIGGGRGVGIGMTWDARAEVRGNLVTRYWKGIGVFVNATATVEHNIVEDIITWGISLWDAGGGEPRGIIRGNAVYRTGACGIAITLRTPTDPGQLAGNAVARTGQDPGYDAPDRYCYQCALAIHGKPDDFLIDGNTFYENRRASTDLPDHDVPEAEFRAAIRPLLEALSPRPALQASNFLRDFVEAQTP
jgi:hypothetical protein